MVAARPLILATAGAALFVACSSEDSAQVPASIATIDGGPSAEAEASVGPHEILPYPAGPYGAAVGATVGDFRVQGYALSRTSRDSTTLPFRDITLGEARSEPGCTCLLILWNAAGQNCQPCVEADTAMADAVARDPSFCVLEVIFTSFDTFNGKVSYIQPPTRADLDAFTQSGRPNFPVGLVTDGAFSALGAGAINGWPSEFVVRTSDMRIAGMIFGRHDDLLGEAKALCAAPRKGPESLATGIAPHALALDATYAFLTDASRSVLRVPVGGGPKETVATTAGDPGEIALDTSNVYWTERVASDSFAIRRAVKAPSSSASDISASASAFTSLAADGTRVYFTRVDGVVGSASVAGGDDVTLSTGEADPASILVDAANVYWLARTTGEVVRMAKGGGDRTTLAPATKNHRAQILLGTDDIVIMEGENEFANGAYIVPKAGGDVSTLAEDQGSHGLSSISPANHVVDYVQTALRGLSAGKDDEGIAHFSLDADANGYHWGDTYTIGQRDIVAIASQVDYVYWITNGASGGALVRMKR